MKALNLQGKSESASEGFEMSKAIKMPGRRKLMEVRRWWCLEATFITLFKVLIYAGSESLWNAACVTCLRYQSQTLWGVNHRLRAPFLIVSFVNVVLKSLLPHTSPQPNARIYGF